MGHFIMGLKCLMRGDFLAAIASSNKATQTAQDPFFAQFPRYLLGVSYVKNGQYQEAEEALQEVASYSRDFGCEQLGTLTQISLGLISIVKGQMSQGLKMIEEALRNCLKNHRRCWYAIYEHALGQVYLQIVDKAAPITLSTMAKNVGFILKNVPSATKKAEEHFNRAIEVAREIGAKGTLGQAYLDLGRLHRAKGRKEAARDCISEAIQFFEQCEAEGYLKQAKEALENLG